MRNDEKGYMSIETLAIFIPFTLLMLAVVMLVNVVTLQAKVHYALTKTAEAISVVSYLTTKPDNVGDSLSDFTSTFNRTFNVADAIGYDEIEWLIRPVHEWNTGDIEKIFNYFMWVNEDANSLQGLIGGYDAFDFKLSKVTDNSVILTVEYKIDYTFTGVIQPVTALAVKQTAATRIWKNGDGRDIAYWRSGG